MNNCVLTVIPRILCLLFLWLAAPAASAQWYQVKGTVFDSTRTLPIEYVSVMTTAGKGAITDAEGRYTISVQEQDSIWFSYLGKSTQKFPVQKITTPYAFDISIQINFTVMKEVRVRPRNYRQDSIQNRQDYARIFEYQKPKIKTVTPQYGMGAGFDLNELINAFRFRRNRSIQSFQARLLQQERDKYIDYRFSKALVRKLTGLEGPAQDSFRLLYRPSYFFTTNASDYDFQLYIVQAYARYKQGLPPLTIFQKELDEEE